MRGIAKIVFNLFNIHGEDLDFDIAVRACEEAGLSLHLGTFRANKSLWKKMQSMKNGSVNFLIDGFIILL
jgi:hypothetical protein